MVELYPTVTLNQGPVLRMLVSLSAYNELEVFYEREAHPQAEWVNTVKWAHSTAARVEPAHKRFITPVAYNLLHNSVYRDTAILWW